MKHEYPDSEKGRARKVFVLGLMSVTLLLISSQRSAAQQYYNSFSSMLDKSSMWRNSFYNDIIRANSGSFGQVSNAPQVTQQEIKICANHFPAPGPSQASWEANRHSPHTRKLRRIIRRPRLVR